MNGYQLREWLRYRWRSTGRHGMHSPFVYRLVDEALKPAAGRIPAFHYRNAAGRSLELAGRDRDLLRRIIYYTRVGEIQPADAAGTFTAANLYRRDAGASAAPGPEQIRFRRLFLLPSADVSPDPALWLQCVSALRRELRHDDLVAIPGIFASPRHTAAWTALCRDLPQRLSIDFFRLGLLFFREEFLVPQQFRVKFPL